MQRSDGGYEQDPTTVPSIHDDQIDMGDDGGAWFAYAPLSAVSGPDPRRKPELADLGRLARRGVNMAVRAARVDEQPSVHAIVAAHLGDDLAHDAGIAQQRWAGYESVNMQRAIDAWISAPGRTHQVVGVMMQSPDMGLADLVSGQNMYGMPSPQPTSVSRVNLPCGPGQMQACAQSAVYLVSEENGRRTVLFARLASPQHGIGHTSVEIASTDPAAGEEISAQLRELATQLNCYRGQVLSLGQDAFGYSEGMFTFHERPTMTREQLVLEDGILEAIERQVVGVSRHRDALLRAGQHLKRGVLLFGPPGVGKTHTIRYLSSTLPETTVLMVSGEALGLIGLACSVARALQPSLVVVEDVDLIAEDRGMHPGQHPLLFELLNEMDGLAGDAEVCFLLTTNRADLLEPALASRPGRVDQAIEIELPDLQARRRLLELYARDLTIEASSQRLEAALTRMQGVTASFLKELLRRSALLSAEEAAEEEAIETGDDVQASPLVHRRPPRCGGRGSARLTQPADPQPPGSRPERGRALRREWGCAGRQRNSTSGTGIRLASRRRSGKGRGMTQEQSITVSRTIDAPAKDIFEVLSNPARHAELDAAGHVVSDHKTDRITANGQVFTMNMHGDHMGGDYQTDNHVVGYDENKLLAWKTAPAGTEPPGWQWVWTLTPTSQDATDVSLTYDWSQVTDKELLKKVSFPLIPAQTLEASLGNLAAAVAS